MGTLTPGKIANFVIYDRDFIDDEAESIPDAHLYRVYIDGEKVYEG